MTEVVAEAVVMAAEAGADTVRGRCTILSALNAAKMPRFRSSRSATGRFTARIALARCAMSEEAVAGEEVFADANHKASITTKTFCCMRGVFVSPAERC